MPRPCPAHVSAHDRSRPRPYLIDLESTHGTFLNGTRIEPARYIELRPRDLVRFAHSSREYVVLVEDLVEADADVGTSPAQCK